VVRALRSVEESEVVRRVQDLTTGTTTTTTIGIEIDGLPVQIEGRPYSERLARSLRGLAGRMEGCQRGWIACTTGEAGVRWLPMSCGQVTCPTCQHDRSDEVQDLLLPAVLAGVAQGCTVVHDTTTRRVPTPEGGRSLPALTSEESAELGIAGGGRSATGGESLLSTWDGMRGLLRSALDGRGYRNVHRSQVLAEIMGWEVTQRAQDGDHLRWHVHVHRLLILAPGVEVEHELDEDTGRRVVTGGPWWDAWLTRWTEVADATTSAQRATVVALPGEQDEAAVRRALGHAIKYAGQIDGMTTAGIVEFVSTIRGRHVHQRTGALHGTCGIGRDVRAVTAWDAWEGQWRCRSGLDPWEVLDRWGWETRVERDAHALACRETYGAARWDAALSMCQALHGHDETPPLDGTLAARLPSGRAVLLTRSRLRSWAEVGRSIWLAVLPGVVVSDQRARSLAAGQRGLLSWVRLDAREVMRESGADPPRPWRARRSWICAMDT
jgi:hypothetical protein